MVIRCRREIQRANPPIPSHAPEARSFKYNDFQPVALANTRSSLVSQKKNQHEKERFNGMKYARPTMPRLKKHGGIPYGIPGLISEKLVEAVGIRDLRHDRKQVMKAVYYPNRGGN